MPSRRFDASGQDLAPFQAITEWVATLDEPQLIHSSNPQPGADEHLVGVDPDADPHGHTDVENPYFLPTPESVEFPYNPLQYDPIYFEHLQRMCEGSNFCSSFSEHPATHTPRPWGGESSDLPSPWLSSGLPEADSPILKDLLGSSMPGEYREEPYIPTLPLGFKSRGRRPSEPCPNRQAMFPHIVAPRPHRPFALWNLMGIEPPSIDTISRNLDPNSPELVKKRAYSQPAIPRNIEADEWVAPDPKKSYLPLPMDPEAQDYYAFKDGQLGILRTRRNLPRVFNPFPDESYLPVHILGQWRHLNDTIEDKKELDETPPSRDSFLVPVAPTPVTHDLARQTFIDKVVGDRHDVQRTPSADARNKSYGRSYLPGSTSDDAARNILQGASCTSSPNHRGIPIPPDFREDHAFYDANYRFNISLHVENDEDTDIEMVAYANTESHHTLTEYWSLVEGSQRITTTDQLNFYSDWLKHITRVLDESGRMPISRREKLTDRLVKLLRIFDNQLIEPRSTIVDHFDFDLRGILEPARAALTRNLEHLTQFRMQYWDCHTEEWDGMNRPGKRSRSHRLDPNLAEVEEDSEDDTDTDVPIKRECLDPFEMLEQEPPLASTAVPEDDKKVKKEENELCEGN